MPAEAAGICGCALGTLKSRINRGRERLALALGLDAAEMIEVPAFNEGFPTRKPCRVAIVLKDGRRYEGSCDVPKGEISRPHAPAEIERKFYQLATPVWGERRARELRQLCLTLETVPDLRECARAITL